MFITLIEMLRHGRFLLPSFFMLLVACGAPSGITPSTPPLLSFTTPLKETPTLASPAGAAVASRAQPDEGAPSPLPPEQSPTPALPDTGWQSVRTGLERRVIQLLGEEGQVIERVFLLRMDPRAFRFQVAYHPGEPQTLLNWQLETGALVVVNGGYFTESYVATGLVISDGVSSGVSYGDFAGMFAVTNSGPEIRWLQQQPYDPAESLLAGLQSFPLLLKPGGLLGFPDETGRTAQRTVVAQDDAGHVLFLVTSGSSFTLHELSSFLTESDLGLDVALNLDGGPSTGLILSDPPEWVSPHAYVPTVILVYPNP